MFRDWFAALSGSLLIIKCAVQAAVDIRAAEWALVSSARFIADIELFLAYMAFIHDRDNIAHYDVLDKAKSGHNLDHLRLR